MSTSLAAVFEENQVRLQTLATPRPGAGEVLVALEGCTLCASDLHTLAGRRSTQTPIVLGHEAIGRIVEWGPNVPATDWSGASLTVGDRITWAIATACGDCFYCERDLPEKCLNLSKFGHHPAPSRAPADLLRGGLATHCVLAPGAALFKLSESLPLASACPANCATATVAAALESADRGIWDGSTHARDTWRGRQVIVVGAGMLGLTAIAMLREFGTRVIAVDRSPSRLTIAKRFGAEAVLAEANMTLPEMHEGHGADCLLEMTGSPQALASTWPYVRSGGAVVLVGAVFPSLPFSLDLEHVVRRRQTLTGVHNYGPRHLAAAIQFLAQTDLPLESLVSKWLPLADIGEAIAAAESGAHVRVGVRTEAC